MKEVQLIWSYPRIDALKARVAQAVKEELNCWGWSVAELDRYREEFAPLLISVDKRSWPMLEQNYSESRGNAAAFVPIGPPLS